MALTVVWQERRSIAHWSFAAGMLVLAVEAVCSGLSAESLAPETLVEWQSLRLVAMGFLPGVWVFFSLTYARGNYKEFLKRWRVLLAAAFLVPATLGLAFRHDLVTVRDSATLLEYPLEYPGIGLHLIFLLCVVLTLMNLERTFRASVGTMRWRIKFMVLGLVVLFAARAYTSSQILLFHRADLSLQAVDSGALIVACLLILRSLLRTGHFEVSVYPSHSVLHNSLTILLTGIYLLVVGVFAKFLSLVGGDTSFALEAFVILIALAFLTLLLLSDRMRMHTKRFVSRHFQRPLYDYRTVWRSFTEGTASRLDQMELCRAIVKLVTDIFQALSVTLWLADDQHEKLIFAASTALSEAKGAALSPPVQAAAEVMRALRNQPDPVDIDSSNESWAATLKQCHPEQFNKGGGRVCVPMMVAGDLVGLIILGDRVGGLAFLQQDFDLLKCVGDQGAASLRSVQLSSKLFQVKELEAFQAMSAFFVHDLKNTASTLGLMLQNLPIHFNDPAFREDALRGVSKTVTRINHLIGRLSLLRHGLEIQPVDSDLNEVVSKALAGWKEATEVDLVKVLRPIPRASFDPEQMLKVITNLVFNAREALSRDGRIRIETDRITSWLVLSVSDNGCGMSPEFLNRSLFRAFQTTKKTGLGIGMFQSKMIVEAHGGRIEVESEPAKGTTFRVLLPLKSQIK